MSKEVFTQVIRGAHEWVKQAEEALDTAIAEKGADTPIGWGAQTAYYLPMSYSMMGVEAKTGLPAFPFSPLIVWGLKRWLRPT